MHNLGTVYSFEILRTMKKKTFWVAALSFPILMVVVFAIIFLSNKTTQDAAEKMKEAHFSSQMSDESRIVNPGLAKKLKIATASSREDGISAVKSGKIDAYYYFPKDLSKERVQVYAKEAGIFDNGKYQSVAENLLKQSASEKVEPGVASVLSESTGFDSTMFKDGKEYDGLREMLAPGLFLLLFYFLIATFTSQTLSSTTEEKENRVIEMILTTIEARTLIVGKIFALITLSLIQVCIVLLPIIFAYFFLREQLSIPSLDLATLPLNPVRIGAGFLIFIFSYLLYTGLLVAIGAAAPTAKEANSFAGIILMAAFAPLYAVTLFISQPQSLLVQFLSYFPLTSPIPLLLRNAVGNLQPHELAIAVAILAVSACVAIAMAVKIFQYGILEYSSKLSLKRIFAKN